MSEEEHNSEPATGNPEVESIVEIEAIVKQYEAPLLRYAARLVNDSSAAQDVVQKTFIKLFRAWKTGSRPTDQLNAWLYRVAHNAAVDYIRAESRRYALMTRHADEHHVRSQPPRAGDGISEAAERAAAALQELTLREQQLVILKVYEEKSYREISEITKLSESNVGYILHHAMKKMAAILKKQAKNKTDDTD